MFDCGTSLWHDHLFRWGGPEDDAPSKPFAEVHSEQIKLARLDELTLLEPEEAAADLDTILASAPRFMDDARREAIRVAFETRAGMLRKIVLEPYKSAIPSQNNPNSDTR